MNEYDKPTLETVRHGYPFLLDYGFDGRNAGKLSLGNVQQMIDEYLTRHIRFTMTKKGSSPEMALELLIKEIRLGHIGKDMYGSLAGDIAEKLIIGKDITLKSEFDGMAALELKRFGECLGINPVDSYGNRHELATGLFDGMAQPDDVRGFRYLHPFVHAWHITMPRWQAYGDRQIDVAAELVSAARYVPDVEWYTDAATITAEDLFNCYIRGNGMYGINIGGVVVGGYHGIPVRMQVLFGEEKSDQVWRRGAISRDGVKLLFDNQSGGSAYIRYGVCTTDESNVFKEAAVGIDYMVEQHCLKRSAEVLLDAFVARHLAETIANNPHWVAWKLKEPQAEVATV